MEEVDKYPRNRAHLMQLENLDLDKIQTVKHHVEEEIGDVLTRRGFRTTRKVNLVEGIGRDNIMHRTLDAERSWCGAYIDEISLPTPVDKKTRDCRLGGKRGYWSGDQ